MIPKNLQATLMTDEQMAETQGEVYSCAVIGGAISGFLLQLMARMCNKLLLLVLSLWPVFGFVEGGLGKSAESRCSYFCYN